ncbi:MAG: hypothetical protein ACYC35_21460 [Pirellulales bacterium]
MEGIQVQARVRQLRRRIGERTHDGIEELGIEVDGDRIVLRGRVASYYALQLVFAAVMETIGPVELESRIEVSSRSHVNDVYRR